MTMRLLAWLACAACVFGVQTATYNIRPSGESRFALIIEKTGLMSGKRHQFLFERYSGTLSYDPESPARSHIEFTIEAASAVCKDTWLSPKDLHKVQDYALHDMLAVERFPEITFSSTAVTPKDETTFEVQGVLAIRGIARPVVVAVTVEKRKAAVVAVSGHAVVRLKDYGVKPPSAALGTIGTKNEMAVEFRLYPKDSVY